MKWNKDLQLKKRIIKTSKYNDILLKIGGCIVNYLEKVLFYTISPSNLEVKYWRSNLKNIKQ